MAAADPSLFGSPDSAQEPGGPGLDPAVLQAALRRLDEHGGEPLPWTRLTGEPAGRHGRGIDSILQAQGADLVSRLVGILACSQPVPDEAALAELAGADFAPFLGGLLDSSTRLLALSLGPADDSLQAGRHQAETLRRMTMAMARDVRVVMVRLASGLQTLRQLVAQGLAGEAAAQLAAIEALSVLAPLANRLGLFRLKWEMEDLAFRCAQPEVYHSLARQLESRRLQRERFVAGVAEELASLLKQRGIRASVTGRPKHLYSIHNKLQSKELTLDRLHDLRAVRVLVETLEDCYAALDEVHQRWEPEPREFDDYIAKPKPNGYRSLHTVVMADDGNTLEVQIRTREMHEQAEYGVAAHWRYKEGSMPGAAASSAGSAGRGGKGGKGGKAGGGAGLVPPEQADRLAWLRQLLAWQQDVGMRLGAEDIRTTDDSRIFAMTPQGRVIELPAGATPVDFAYHVHSALGHRCRGAKVDGRIVPLNTPLANGQVVEITAARRTASGSAGPSRDWLNPALGYIRSHRARTKVRQWFNVQQHDAELAAGRERVDKTLAREGRTSLSLDELASRLGRSSPAELFTEVARDVIGIRALEEAIRAPSGAGGAAAAKPAEPAAVWPVGDARTAGGTATRAPGN
nr:bifunctional (p)ppGpp synthetase/guanosine-3',5'-bis(diphosphate) 3'-pyrophosphohydrolase [Lautropia sp.]